MAEYEFWLTDDSGRRITLLKNTAFMSLSRTTQGYGTLHIGIPFRDFKVFPAFLPDRRVEVWRSLIHGATMRREGSFFLRKYNIYTRERDEMDIIEFYGRSPIDILRRQHVTSTTLADYQKTNEIDDMMKEIVDENFITPPQTAPSGELSVSGTQGLGPSISHTFFGQNVLDILKELRDISFSLNDSSSSNRRIYFDVVEGSPLSNGGFGYAFRTYADLRGTDRTNENIFSVENGNLKSPSYFEDHLDSSTHALSVNPASPANNGEATSPELTLSRWNDIVVAQQTSETDVNLNESKANEMLQGEKAEYAFNATILDSPGSDRQPRSLYGVDWDLGDLLRVRYAGKDFNTEVQTVYVSVDEDGKENIVGMTSPRVISQPDRVPGTWVTAAGPLVGDANVAGWSGYTLRQVIATAQLSNTGLVFVRLTFYASTAQALTVGAVRIENSAMAGDVYDFEATPVLVTFNGGSTGFAIALGASIVSDPIEFTIDAAKDLVVSFYVSGGASNDDVRAKSVQAGWTAYFKAAVDDTATVNATGYTGPTAQAAQSLLRVETAPAA